MDQPLNLRAMENCVCFNLRWVSRAFTQFYDAQLSQHGLLPTQTPILAALASMPEANMADLSEWLGMDRTTLVRNLRPLERKGLIVVHNKGRGGKVTLAITPEGKTALAQLKPAWDAAQQAVVDTLGEQRWSEILVDLERAAMALKK